MRTEAELFRLNILPRPFGDVLTATSVKVDGGGGVITRGFANCGTGCGGGRGYGLPVIVMSVLGVIPTMALYAASSSLRSLFSPTSF